MATFCVVFFSQCQRLQAKYTEFAGSCSREHLFVPSAVEFPCFAQMCHSTKNTEDTSTPHQPLYLLCGSSCFWLTGHTETVQRDRSLHNTALQRSSLRSSWSKIKECALH